MLCFMVQAFQDPPLCSSTHFYKILYRRGRGWVGVTSWEKVSGFGLTILESTTHTGTLASQTTGTKEINIHRARCATHSFMSSKSFHQLVCFSSSAILLLMHHRGCKLEVWPWLASSSPKQEEGARVYPFLVMEACRVVCSSRGC
jgi:hypothetical protein